MRATDLTSGVSPSSTSRPVSPRKLAANRANAARSTGPRSDAGKERSAMNAVRHGLAARAALLRGEDGDELDALARELEADLRPIGAAERELVGRVVSLSWRLRRVAAAEEALWDADDADRTRSFKVSAHLRTTFGYPLTPGDEDEPPAPRAGAAFVAAQFTRRDTSALERLAVYEQRLDRALHATLRQLQQLRKMRADPADEEPDAVTERQPVAPAPVDDLDAQNEPTAGESPAFNEVAVTSSDGTVVQPEGRPIVQNEPTAGEESATERAEQCVGNEPTASEESGPSGFVSLTRSDPAWRGKATRSHG